MPKPGDFKGSKYYRRTQPGARKGKLTLHDRRLNPVGKHFYGRDAREFSKIPVKQHRRKGRIVRRTVRRR